MTFLEIKALHKRYAATEVLRDVNIQVEEGEFLVLLGPSGCGKSTLLNAIAGLESITKGDILMANQSLAGLHPSKRDIAMVFQSYALYPNMTVAQNIAFGMEMRGVPKPERLETVASIAQILQLSHLLGRKPSQLSGGQRQRVAMGRALVRKPKLFLFDEPLSNLDSKLRVEMRTEIKRLHQRLGTTIIYVTHDQVEAMTLASKIAVLKDGCVQQLGTSSEIYNTPNNVFVAEFVGSPSMNLMPCRVEKIGDNFRLLLLEDDEKKVEFFLAKERADFTPYLDQEIILGIRPEAIMEFKEVCDASDTYAKFSCLVDIVEPTGSDTFVVACIKKKEIIARLHVETSAQPRKKITLGFDMRKAVFFDSKTGNAIA